MAQIIKSLKNDFGRMGREKSEIIKSLEKWYVFPNRFLAIANRCADLHQRLSMALPRAERDMNAKIVRSSDPDFVLKSKRRSKLISDITECCIELPILMPIMFETFIGMIVAFLTKAGVRGNERLFQTFKKSALDVKIFDLHTRCDGFMKPVDPANPVMSRYWSVVNRRNDIMHGNIDPVRDATEVIYFDGKKPLYTSGADRIVYHWRGLIRQYDPERVLRDYLTTHEFIIEILDHMMPSSRQTFILLMAEAQPGWDDRRKKLGILFPDHLHMTNYGELRYDGDLKA
ncbi:hypothetical protein [Sphingomonas sp. Leaf257]|uniref:hypothetical protein n=1 Tax=Sphingomonas sp. Leaf257 TaxID=1736309 RepID=UPI0012E18704|nr:hypothetical protein [Sphingomonas sp. Leaf257]